MTSTRRGFTFVELMIVVTIVGILASIAIPKFRDLKRRATAAQILGDFDVVRHAAMTFLTDSGYFPPESGSGQASESMTAYLPTNFKMAKPEWTMDYDHFKILGMQIVAVSFTTPDAKLGQTAMKLMGHSTAFSFGGKYVVVISGM
jgi:prepilin-type N-terminal cleavage/methylation domain-containing protein